MRRILSKVLLLVFAVCVATIANAQVNYYSLSGATDFANPASWTTDATGAAGTAPAALTNADNFTILAGATMTLNADATVRQLTNKGSLNVAANTLYIERATNNQALFDNQTGSTLSLLGGAIKVKGSVNFSGTAAFIQSGGDLYIDGNSGATGTTTNPSTPLLNFTSSTAMNCTGGSWTFPDPHGNTSTTAGAHEIITYNTSVSSLLSATHTINFGDGVSTSAGGNTNGFRCDFWTGSGRLTMGSVNFNGVSSATNRFSTFRYVPAMVGTLTVTSGEGRFATLYTSGDIVVNSGATLTMGTLYMIGTSIGSSTGNIFATNPQSITNNGTIRSAATPVANLEIGTLFIGNNSATGVTLNSPLNVGSLSWSGIFTTTTTYQGYLNTTATNILKIVGSGGTGVTTSTLSTATTNGSNGDNDAYVKGPLQMVLGTGFSSATNIAGFPVGASAFNPLSFTGISGAPTSATTIQVEAFDSNSGTAGTGVTAPPSKRWDVSVVSGALPIGGMKVRVSDPSITANSLLTRSASATGTYDIAGGGSTFSAAPNATTYTVASVVTTSNITSANLTASYSFGDNTNPPSCAALTVPVNAAQIYTNPTLTWTAGAGAASYDVYVSTTSPAYDALNPTTNLVGNVTTTSFVYTLTAPGTFYWTAIAKNINGSATACAERSFTTAAPGNCGTLSTPVNAAQVFGSPTLTWTAATGAASYDVYLSTTSPAYDALNPSNNLLTNVTGTSYATTLTSTGTYYWAVVAKNITASATGCTERNFVSIPPACPALALPAAAAIDVEKNPLLTWAAATAAASYDLYVSTTSPAYDPANPTTNLVTNTTALSYGYTTFLNTNTLYYWTVVSKSAVGSSLNCTERTFTTGTSPRYCAPIYTTGKTVGDLIANIAISGTTLANNSGLAQTNPAYTFFSPSLGANYTADLSAGTSYVVSVSIGTWGSQGLAAWIDYNDNGDFETSEKIGFTNGVIGTGTGGTPIPANHTTTFQIALACNPPVGPHRLRVREVFNLNGNLIDPCISYAYGETEDYIVNVLAPPPCPQPGFQTQVAGPTPATTRTFDWTPGCTETEWEVFVQPAGGPIPTLTTVPTDLSITARPYTATVPYGSNLEYWVRAVCTSGSVYSGWTGPSTFTTPDILPNCANLVSPLDMATSVSLNTNVDWTAPTGGGGTPTSYDVYFGQTLPGTPTTNVAATVFTYKPTITLDYLTTYTWQIIPKNATGAATGCPVYTFTTEPVQPPACPAISAPAAGATGVVKNPTLTWVSVQGATSYDLYFSATSPAYDPLSPATNLVGNFTTTSYTFPTNLLANTPYYWAVIAKNSAGNSSNCTEYSFTTGDIIAYCPPVYTAGCTDNDLIARVTLNTLDNNSGTQCTSGALGYVDYRNNPALTTTLNAGTSYNCQVYVGQWSEAFAVWIDYNDNGIFETPSERIGYTTINPAGSGTAGVLGGSATFPITLSCAPPVGVHSMRVRCVFGQSGINIDPCASYTWGETEDYIVTVAPPPPCPVPAALTAPSATTTTATLAWTPGCLENEWDVHVTSVGGGAPTGAPSNPGVLTNPTVTINGLTSTTQYDYYVRAVCGSTTTSAWVGPFTFSTLLDNDEACGAINLTVGAPPVSVNTAYATVGANDPANACSANNNTVWYKFTPATSGDYKVLTTFATPQTFSPWIFVGTMLTCNDAFAQVSVGCLGTASNTVASLVGGQEYYIFVDGNSGSNGPMTIAVQEIAPVISAKVFLNNIDLTTGLLTNYFNDPANSFPNFPTTDPYSVSGAFNGSFVHVNNPTPQTTTALVLNATPTTGNGIVDWVFLELRNGVSGSTTVVATKAALLQRDGDIVDTDGVSPVPFNNAPSGDYFVAVRHRSHLGFRTDAKVTVTASTPTLDFATNQVQLYGATPNVVLNPSVATMVGADANSDGSIDAFDTIIWEQQNGLFDDYTNNGDYNMDGSVDALDSIIWELHNGKFEDLF